MSDLRGSVIHIVDATEWRVAVKVHQAKDMMTVLVIARVHAVLCHIENYLRK